jgi:hypothetical protein
LWSIDNCWREIDQSRETLGFCTGSYDYSSERLEFGEKILDEVPPFINFGVDGKRLGAPEMNHSTVRLNVIAL